jgi:hypothetical protein
MKFSKIDLYSSIEKGNTEETKRILSNNFEMDNKTGEWALFLAYKNNNKTSVELLNQQGASIRKSGILKGQKIYLSTVNSN